KPVRVSRRILEGLELAKYFRPVYGGNSFATKKPDPLGARKIVEELGATAGETMMVGDSEVDVQTARNARRLRNHRPSWFPRPSRQAPLQFFSRPVGQASWLQNCSRHKPGGNISPAPILPKSFYSRARACWSAPPWESRAVL